MALKNKDLSSLIIKSHNRSPWQTITLFFYSIAFFYLFIQNFLFSESFDILDFREVDDVAFQLYLRNVHNVIMHFITHPDINSLQKVFYKCLSLNGYAYGWLFWFPLAIITFPLYILSINYGIDAPLIIFPRQLSLLFSFATAFFLYKSVSIYTKNTFLKMVAMLLFLSFPTFGYFSERFGTVAQTMFFSCLAFYLAIRHAKLAKRDLTVIALALAAAGGTKLSGLLIAPLIGLIVMDRLEWRINQNTIKQLLYFSLIFIFALIFFLNPGLFSLPFKPILPPVAYFWHQFSTIILEQINKTHTNYGEPLTLLQKFNRGIIYNTLHPITFYILITGMFAYLFKIWRSANNPRKRDFLYILLALFIAALYLVIRINMGIAYISIYFTVVSFLLVPGILFLEYFPYRYQYVLGVGILTINIIFNWSNMFGPSYVAYNAYYKRYATEHIKQLLQLQKEMQCSISLPNKPGAIIRILRDYNTPSIYSGIRNNVHQSLIFDNIHDAILYNPMPHQIIAFNKNAMAFLPEQDFQNILSNSSPNIARSYKEHRELVKQFLDNHILQGQKYKLLFDKNNILVFTKVEEEN